MLKIFIGFVLFAALALFIIFKGGDKVDMTGEKHGSEAVEVKDEKAAEATPAAPTAPAADKAAGK